jgi:Arc/MetJ family transcription regulator
MRTNVVLDESLVAQAKQLTGIKTTRAIIDEALRTLVQLRQQQKIRDLRGRLQWEGDLAALREARSRYVLGDDDASGGFDCLD